MAADMERIWTRNLGRDDRCLSDHGREVTRARARAWLGIKGRE